MDNFHYWISCIYNTHFNLSQRWFSATNKGNYSGNFPLGKCSRCYFTELSYGCKLSGRSNSTLLSAFVYSHFWVFYRPTRETRFGFSMDRNPFSGFSNQFDSTIKLESYPSVGNLSGFKQPI